jgi:cob(I)alamin adenosyltransferase
LSICTKTGDAGTTGLMYNRRVSKTHPRIEGCGSVDELNAAIGVARAASCDPEAAQKLVQIQKELVTLMGEVATHRDDLQRYRDDGFQLLTAESPARLESWIKELESHNFSFHGWATPGDNPASAALDLARAVSRRAERSIQKLIETGDLENRLLQIYLNRVSDFLWLLARAAETPKPSGAPPGRD